MLGTAALAFALTLLVSISAPSVAGTGLQTGPPPAASGKDLLQRKCFQCHQASMWTSSRGDRKMWEGVLYRMVGRGALWTEAEISAMAEFLATTRPLQTPNSQNPKPKE